MTIMAARSDRALQTARTLLAQQLQTVTSSETALSAEPRARIIVGVDELLIWLNSPSTGRPIGWAETLRRCTTDTTLDAEMVADLLSSNDDKALSNVLASRAAVLTAALDNDLPAALETRHGVIRTSDLLRVVVVQLVVLCLRAAPQLALPASRRDTARALCQALGERHPGHTIEVRVPPAAAVQIGAIEQGPTHTRGTPPNVAEMSETTWIEIAAGLLDWDEARRRGIVQASGSHVDDLALMLPVVRTVRQG